MKNLLSANESDHTNEILLFIFHSLSAETTSVNEHSSLNGHSMYSTHS
jgi:hypothetical protein